MKKSIIVVFLLVVILLLPTACKKDKKVFSNNGFLFTASESKIEIKHPKSSSYSLMYLDLITKEKKEIKNLTSFSPHRMIISPDRKYFIMFFIKIDAIGQKRYDLYTMKADGSDFQCVSEKLGIIDLDEYGNSYPRTYGFSPDFQSIILIKNRDEKLTQKQIYIISLDGSSYQNYKEGDESFPALDEFLQGTSLESYDSNIQDFAYRSFHQKVLSKTWDSQQQIFLLAIKNTLGLFSWKTMTYTPFYEHSAEISSCSISPDKKYILFNEGFEKTFQVEGSFRIEKYEVFDVYCYSTDTKAIHKIITQEPIEDLSWLNNGYQFFYLNLMIEEDNLFNCHRVRRVLYLYDLHAMKSEKILDRCCIHTIDSFSNELYITASMGLDSAYPSVLNLSKKTIEELHGIDDLWGYSYEDRIQNSLLYIFYSSGFFSINPVNMQVQMKTFLKHNGEIIDDENLDLDFSPDDKIVCYNQRSFFSAFDFQGKELIQYPAPKDHIIENIFFLNAHSIVYIESVRANGYPISSIYTSNLYFYSHKTKKTTKLTNEDWGRIKCYRLSPDQRYVAVVRVESKNLSLYSYSIDYVSLVEIGKKKPITRFTRTENWGDAFTIQWSPDSQFLYYSGISSFTNETSEENGKDGIPSVKCFSLKENKIWDNKSTEGCINFNLSPNGLKFVLLSKDQDRIWIMDTNKIKGINTGEYKQIGSQLDQSVYFFDIEWSSDSKKIVYMNNQNELFITDSEGYLLFKKDLAQTNNPLYKNINYRFLFPDHFFSPSNQEEVYIKQYTDYDFNSQAFLLLNLKQEIILEGTILDYQWSPDGKELLLMENKVIEENHYEDSHYIVTHLKLYHTNDRTYTPLQFNLKKIMDVCWSKDGAFVYAFGEDLETNQIILKRLNKNGEHLETVFVFGNAGTHFLGSLDGIEKIEQLEALK